MKTTYINNDGKKCGFIVSKCGRWVDCFKGDESNIINSFFTFGHNGSSHSRPNITPQYSIKEIALQQRFAVLHRKQNFVHSECDNLNLSDFNDAFKYFKENKDNKDKKKYCINFFDHLNTLTKDKEKTIVFFETLSKMYKS